MKTIYIFIAFFLFLTACGNKEKNNIYNETVEMINFDEHDLDSILSNIESVLEEKVESYQDSILKYFDLTTTLKFNDMNENATFLNIKNAISRGDTILYRYNFDRRPQTDKIDYTPYALYMANKFNYSRAYKDVYTSLFIINKYRGGYDYKADFDVTLDSINSNQRSLALLYLIKGYKKGVKETRLTLSYYFKDGLYYFPKNDEIYKKLLSDFRKDIGDNTPVR